MNLWRTLNTMLAGAVIGFAYLVLQGFMAERDAQPLEVDCSAPLKPNTGRVNTVVADHRTIVKCKFAEASK
jgi:hypothetical protein